MSGTDPRGRFVWYECLTSDPDAAIEFYTTLIGWGTQPWEGEQPYTMWTNGETPLGGVMQLPEEAKAAGAPPHWLGAVATPDVDATAEQAKELGGKLLHGPEDVPGAGRYAVLSDPQGAVISIYTSGEEVPVSNEMAKVGEFSWNELATSDRNAAFEFYRSLFGWETKDEMDMGELGIYHIYGVKERPIPLGGIFNKPAEIPGPPRLALLHQGGRRQFGRREGEGAGRAATERPDGGPGR